MIRIATIEQIRAIEKAADESGYSYSDMMDSAGRAVADRAALCLKSIDKPRVTALVGAGNNGGDGLVAGLYIAQDNPEAEVRFYLLKDRDDGYINTVREADLFVGLAENDSDKRLLRNMVASADLVIDALFGIGVRLPIQGEAQKILRNVNRELNARRSEQPETVTINPTKPTQVPNAAPIFVLAVDCPSGLNCDTGEADNSIIEADETITFIAAKVGQLTETGARVCGELVVSDIGISEKLEPMKSLTDILADSEGIKQKLPKRGGNSHKGTYGRALIIAGSVNYIGAPALAAEGAYRAGAGLVTIAAPNNVILPLAGHLREVTWIMLPHDMGVIAEGAASVVFKDLNKMKSLLIGPGLGTEKTTREFLHKLLQPKNESSRNSSKRKIGFGIQAEDAKQDEESDETQIPPLVIDADGLNLLAEIDNWCDFLPEDTLITPHPGEMARLCDTDTAHVQANRWALARSKAQEWGVVVLLKGAHTVIASPDGRLVVLPFVVDSLATAGTGDVLAGLIVGLRAQGLSAWDAAIVGGYVHGLAGQIVSQRFSSRSVIASDVLLAIGEAFSQLERIVT